MGVEVLVLRRDERRLHPVRHILYRQKDSGLLCELRDRLSSRGINARQYRGLVISKSGEIRQIRLDSGNRNPHAAGSKQSAGEKTR